MEGSNAEAIQFLSKCPAETAAQACVFMSSYLSKDSWAFDRHREPSSIPPAGSNERRRLAKAIVEHLGYYGSNSVAYCFRWLTSDSAGVPYKEVLTDVCELLSSRLPSKGRPSLPAVGTVNDYEQILVSTLLNLSFEGKTNDQLATMFQDTGLDAKTARKAAEEFGKSAAKGAALPVLVKVLGKKTVNTIVTSILSALLLKLLGKEAAQAILAWFAKNIPQKTVAGIIGGVGFLWLGWDIAGVVAGPATRITVPIAAIIATGRQLDAL